MNEKDVCRKCSGTRKVWLKSKRGKRHKAPCPSCGGRGKGYATK